MLAKVRVEPVVAVVGASGSGKSSVVRVGVVPRLRAEGWQVATCRIGASPAWALAKGLVELLHPVAEPGTRIRETEDLAARLGKEPEAAVRRIEALTRASFGLFVLLDQFEELVTRAPEHECKAFDALLVALTGAKLDRLRLALTLRSDYEDEVARLDCGRTLLNERRVPLTPMNREELTAAVRGPAKELGVAFENGRDWHLIERVEANGGLLPLMQYALQELWARQHDGRLTEAALQPIGQLEGVLATRAEEVFDGLGEGDAALAERLFVDLVNVAEGGVAHDTKAARTRPELGDDIWRVAQAFAAEGVWLLTTRAMEDGQDRGPTVEITHEALIRHWGRLAEWLDAVREVRLWQQQMWREMFALPEDVPPYTETWNVGECDHARRMLERHDVDGAVRTYAMQMLGNTDAVSIWARTPGARRGCCGRPVPTP